MNPTVHAIVRRTEENYEFNNIGLALGVEIEHFIFYLTSVVQLLGRLLDGQVLLFESVRIF
jgi:hypothetical protein